MDAQGCGGNRCAADSVETVATGNELAFQNARLARVLETDFGFSLQVVDVDSLGLKKRRHTRGDSRGNQVLDHLVLRINCDGFSAGKIGEVDAMASAVESQLDSRVHQAFPPQSLADARFDKQIDGPLLQDARANALLDILLRVRFQNDRMNAPQVQQMGERKSGGSRSDNSNLGSHQ